MNTPTLLISFIPALIYVLLLISYYRLYLLRKNKITDWLEDTKLQTLYRAHDYRTFDGSKKNTDFFRNIIGYSGLSVFISILITITVVWIVTLLTMAKFKLFCPISFQVFCSENGITGNTEFAINNYAFTAAFGAYLWGLFEFLTRYQQRDWTPIIQHQIWLRIPIAMFIAGFTNEIFTSTSGYLVAFGIGAFPLAALRNWLVERSKSTLTIGGSTISIEVPEWGLLQGISVQMIERFQELNIENPTQLANANPMNIYIRTNIEWRQILDLIDQAILISYVGNKIIDLRELGIRSSIDIAVLYERKEKDTKEIIGQISEQLGNEGNEIVWNLITNLYEDTQVNLIWEFWNTENSNNRKNDDELDESNIPPKKKK